jgi:cytochrome c-type biogenesis protein CcmF
MKENPVATLGLAGLLLSLVATALTVGASVAGARRGSRKLIRAGILSAYTTTALITLSSAVMFFLLLSNDFTVKYVQRHSDASMPWYYQLTAFWGGLDGSIMWWVLLLALFSAVAIHVNRERHRELIPYVTAVLFTIVGFFLVLIVFDKRPFDLFLTEAPRMGKGMNPLLQNPYMATHPPSLYLGFVSATVPFAFGVAALITGNLDDTWITSTRRWVIISWYFLSQGLVLGSLWAYEELGWGGYWGWDPVENAGFLPWLTATAFLHSIMIQERRGMLKVWNVSLVILTFVLTMIGTFMTRSGIVQSVHAFGQDTRLAIIFVSFIGFILIFSFGYVIYRLPLLRGRNELESWLSREFMFLLNNWILLSAAFFVLVATLFPTISEALTKERITVGPPFFTQWMAPIGLVLLFLTGVGPLIAWRKASIANLRQQFTFPLLAGTVTAVTLSLIPKMRVLSPCFNQKLKLPLAIICFALCAFTTATIIQEFYRGTRVRQTHTKLDFLTSLIGLVARGKRRYGGYLVHLGVMCMFLGFAGDAYHKEVEATLEKNGTVQLDRYKVRFDGLTRSDDANKEMTDANIVVLVEGKEFAKMKPAKWAFKRHTDEPPTTEVAIKRMAREDLYLVLNGYDWDNGIANLKVVINPLVDWVWFGFLILIVGTIVAFMPDRAYVVAGAKDTGQSGSKKAAAAAAAILVLMLPLGAWAQADRPGAMEQESLHYARSDLERRLFKQIRCLCPTCAHALDECGGECSPGEHRRLEIQKLVDAGQSEQQIIDFSVAKYGQHTLRVPPDKGWNKLAWALPAGGILAAAAGLFVVARRSRRKPAAAQADESSAEAKEDEKYASKLDDELDELD